ncbi:MAG TPA: energy transducer TonB [Puia sp.]|jgi:TonB family protein|nr:energy transducer TonB [Puia sp.]
MKVILVICFSLTSFSVFSQTKEDFFSLDAQWKPTTLNSGVYLIWRHEKNDGNWQWDYYHKWGPMIKSETYLDRAGSILNGRICIYNKIGNLDSTGFFDHGKKEGSFYKLKSYSEDSIRFIREYNYKQDSLIETTDLIADGSGKKEKDSVYTSESEYPGGIKRWEAYLYRQLEYPRRALDEKITGQVRISFIVDENGNILIDFIIKSREYSLDQESIRIIKESPRWIPGKKGGVNSKSYRSQSINFDIRRL